MHSVEQHFDESLSVSWGELTDVKIKTVAGIKTQASRPGIQTRMTEAVAVTAKVAAPAADISNEMACANH